MRRGAVQRFVFEGSGMFDLVGVGQLEQGGLVEVVSGRYIQREQASCSIPGSFFCALS